MYKPVMNAGEIEAYMDEVFPEVDYYGFKVPAVGNGTVTVSMNATGRHLRPGGTVSGPTLFALADCAAYYLVIAHIGKVALAVTTNLNINFVSKPEAGELVAKANLLKLGKRLAVCEISLYSSADERLVAHATATYSIPPRD